MIMKPFTVSLASIFAVLFGPDLRSISGPIPLMESFHIETISLFFISRSCRTKLKVRVRDAGPGRVICAGPAENPTLPADVMRMVTLAIWVLFVTSSGASAFAQTPPADVDAQLTKLAEKRKLQNDLQKETADLVVQIQSQLLAFQKRLVDLNSPPAPMPLNDPLKTKLAEAFKADGGDLNTKKLDAAKLAGIYSAALEKKVAQLPELKTAGDLIEKVRSIDQSLTTDRLTNVRTLIAAELTAILKSHSTPLTDELRSASAALFARIEAALDDVSK